MARIVMKFGGTSVAGPERIRHVARIIQREQQAGHQLAVVVSAMAGETDRLINLCHEAYKLGDPAEYDVVLASGEQVASGLLALTLQAIGCRASSWQGWQLPIRTDAAHGKARISGIKPQDLLNAMAAGEIAVIAGFQGVTGGGRITTLGRGGTDTSAVALAAAIKADRCDIYTDVAGVFTTDPRIVPGARKLEAVTYEEMLELASVGSKVLQTRSVNLAMRERVRVQVLSSFVDDDAPLADTLPGTLVAGETAVAGFASGRRPVTGIAADRAEAKLTLTGVKDRPGTAAEVFAPLSEANITVDMIIQNVARDPGRTDITFTITQADLPRAQALLEERKALIGYDQLLCDHEVAKVSIVGAGMRDHPGTASIMFRALAERSINILAITAAEIKCSVLIRADETELAVRILHSVFELDQVGPVTGEPDSAHAHSAMDRSDPPEIPARTRLHHVVQ